MTVLAGVAGAQSSSVATLSYVVNSPAGGYFGDSISSSADLDGDGKADFVVGASTPSAVGRVQAFRGFDGQPLWTCSDPAGQGGAQFGDSVDIIGDITGDGVPDLIVGACQADGNRGKAFGISGADRSTIFVIPAIGSAYDDRFGNTVRGVGDATGDGVPDFAISASSEDPCCGHYVGTVRVYNSMTRQALWQANGLGSFDYCGRMSGDCPDLNGDGVKEVLNSAPEWYAGSGPGYMRLHDGVTGQVMLTLGGANVHDGFSGSMAMLDDVNGDGTRDVAISSPGSDQFGADRGKIGVYSGSNGALLFEIAPPSFLAATWSFAVGSEDGATAAIPDINGDGHSELAVGVLNASNPNLAGTPNTGAVVVYSGADGALLDTLWGDVPDSMFGQHLRVLQDLTQPGSVHLAVGAIQASRVYVFDLVREWHTDADGDGHGTAPVSCTGSFAVCGAGRSSLSDDCDDTRATVFPGAVEILDGLDNDCDGSLDEGFIGTYCTAGTTTNSCAATMSWSGVPSVSASSGFQILCTNSEGDRYGLILYGMAPASVSWAINSTSLVCVAPPQRRTGASSSGGTLGACDGSYALDFNAFMAAEPAALGGPFTAGQVFYAQAWFRNQGAPKGTNLSNGLRFTLGQ